MNYFVWGLIIAALLGGVWYARSRKRTHHRGSGVGGGGPREVDGK